MTCAHCHAALLCRFRHISHLYSQGVRPLAHDMLELQNWNWLYNATDKLTKGWLTHGARLLQQVTASAKSNEAAMQVRHNTSSILSFFVALGNTMQVTLVTIGCTVLLPACQYAKPFHNVCTGAVSLRQLLATLCRSAGAHYGKIIASVYQLVNPADAGFAHVQRAASSSSSGSGSWQSACGDAFGHSMMDQQLYRLMGKTSGAGSGGHSLTANMPHMGPCGIVGLCCQSTSLLLCLTHY